MRKLAAWAVETWALALGVITAPRPRASGSPQEGEVKAKPGISVSPADETPLPLVDLGSTQPKQTNRVQPAGGTIAPKQFIKTPSRQEIGDLSPYAIGIRWRYAAGVWFQ